MKRCCDSEHAPGHGDGWSWGAVVACASDRDMPGRVQVAGLGRPPEPAALAWRMPLAAWGSERKGAGDEGTLILQVLSAAR